MGDVLAGGGHAGAVPMPHVTFVLGGPAASPQAYRVEAPDRVLRMWALLSAATEEVDWTSMPPGAAGRLQRQLQAIVAELQSAVSPALADELRRLVSPAGAAPDTTAGLRIELASLTGWVGGVVITMLSQLDPELVPALTAVRPATACGL